MAAAAADGGLALDLLDARHVAGIAVSVPCTREAPAAAAGMLPSSQALHLRLPLEAPDVLQLVVPGQQGAAAAAAATGTADLQAGAARQQAQGQAQQAAGQEQRAPAQGQQVQGKAAGKGQVKEEEKTWLQKNWMLVMPLGFIVSEARRLAALPVRLDAGAIRARCASSFDRGAGKQQPYIKCMLAASPMLMACCCCPAFCSS